MLGFILFISLLGVLCAKLTGNKASFVYFVVAAVAYAAFQYFFADKLAIASSGAKQTSKEENPRLYKIVEKLAEDAKLPMPKVYIVNDPAPNAFATGRNPKHACVAATTGLLQIMDDKELRAVMGHEMSHVKNYDIRVSMITFGLASLVGFISDFCLRIMIYGGSSRSDEEEQSPIAIIFAAIAMILAPIAAAIVQSAVSRQREYLADASSAKLIGSTEDMANALRKLDTLSRPMHQQNIASESMYIANPLSRSFLTKMFSTHPSITSRIERLENK